MSMLSYHWVVWRHQRTKKKKKEHKRHNTSEDSKYGHHRIVNTNIRLMIFFTAKDVEALWVSKTRPGADCSSDHELLIAKFRLKLKTVGKTTRAFRYDLNHIPHDYTLEVTNRFKGLDLIERVPKELWMEIQDIVQEAGIRTISKKKKCKKAKWLSEEALQITVKRREQKQRRKGKIYPTECRVPKNSKER